MGGTLVVVESWGCDCLSVRAFPVHLTPPLQSGVTPLHVASINGISSVVALLLATPGVDPLAVNDVRARRGGSGGCLYAFPTPHPSATGWHDSAGLGPEE